MTAADRIRARLAELDEERRRLERALEPPVVLEGGRFIRAIKDLCTCPGLHGHPNRHMRSCALARLLGVEILPGGPGWCDLTISTGVRLVCDDHCNCRECRPGLYCRSGTCTFLPGHQGPHSP